MPLALTPLIWVFITGVKMNFFQLLRFFVVTALLLVPAYVQSSEAPPGVSFESRASALITGSNKQLLGAIDRLAEIEDPRVLATLKHLLNARLYYRKADKQLVIVHKPDGAEGAASIRALFSDSLVEGLEPGDIKKIRINNKIRRALNANISVLELTDKNSDVRLAAAKNLASNPNAELREVIVQAVIEEPSRRVKAQLELALALTDIYSEQQPLRMEAAKVLATTVQPEAVAILNALAEKDEAGNYLESNAKLASFAETASKAVNSKLGLFKVIENLLYGISLGSILLLAAIGLAITFGVMGVINMAHGEMIMLGAYTTFAIQTLFPNLMTYSLLIALPVAFLVSGAMGVLIERLVIRHLYGRPLDTLLATFGISLILQQLVRTYNSNNVSVVSPEWISGFWQINGAISLTYNRLYIVFFSLFVLAVLALLMKKTLAGLQMRAVTQNRAMANSMGIKSSWVDAMTFGLGSGIAGIAGVALSQITSVGPNLGQTYIVDSFMVVVFGGVGNILGTFLGALSLGIANKFIEPYAGAVVSKIVMLIFIILFIQWRPRGLFALKGRFVED